MLTLPVMVFCGWIGGCKGEPPRRPAASIVRHPLPRPDPAPAGGSARGHFSGLLIGHEIVSARSRCSSSSHDGDMPLLLIGDDSLCDRYRGALVGSIAVPPTRSAIRRRAAFTNSSPPPASSGRTCHDRNRPRFVVRRFPGEPAAGRHPARPGSRTRPRASVPRSTPPASASSKCRSIRRSRSAPSRSCASRSAPTCWWAPAPSPTWRGSAPSMPIWW